MNDSQNMNVTEARRAREKEQRREAIVNAAEAVFVAKGLAPATMDEIAERAEYSKGLLYKYFASKEELYLALSLRAFGQMLAAFRRALRQSDTSLGAITAIGHAYAAFAREHPAHFEAVLYHATQGLAQDPASYGAACDAEADKIFDLVAQTIGAGIQDGSIRADVEPMDATMMLWAKLHGLVVVTTFKRGVDQLQKSPEQFLADAIDYVVASMRP
jgi:AcrR family transcriptional regulator